MDEQDIRRIAKQVYDEQATSDQFAVPAVPVHYHNNIDAPAFPFLNLRDVPKSYYLKANKAVVVNETETGLTFGALVGVTNYYTVAKTTNGTTAVDVFDSAGAPYPIVVTGVFLVSQDTTAGNITLKQAANTVVTIAKGTVSGTLVGGVSLANTTYAQGDACTIVSSSAGNATVFITFTT